MLKVNFFRISDALRHVFRFIIFMRVGRKEKEKTKLSDKLLRTCGQINANALL